MLRQLSLFMVPLLLVGIPLYGVLKKQPVYELFVEGAAEGVQMALQILPYLLAMLVAISVFRASGAFQALAGLLTPLTDALGIPAAVLPLALMRSFSGSGALAMTADILQQEGPDSFTGLLASVLQGSTDTTFYILAVYFGAVKKRERTHALPAALAGHLAACLSAGWAVRFLLGAG